MSLPKPERGPTRRQLLRVLFLASIPTTARAAQARGTLTVAVLEARNATGRIGAALFASAAGFPEGLDAALKLAEGTIDPVSRTARIVFDDLPYGAYAVAVRHDENANGRLDKNLFGMPREGYAFSNNPRRRLGAPPFDEARFLFEQPAVTLEIALTY